MTWRDGVNATKWIPVISTAETLNGIPQGLSSRQCYEESRFDPDALNPHSGAIGLFQLLPQYFPGAGRDPVADTGKATKYLASLAKRFGGDWQLALAAYDWGPGSVDKWMKAKGTFDTLPKETRDYVSQIVADVPVEGVLCKIQSPTSPATGSPIKASSPAIQSADSSPSLWSRLSSPFTRKAQIPSLSVSPSEQSAPSSSPISSPTANQPEVSMSTPAPNPVLKAAAPTLITAIADVKACLNTILTGDPLQIGLRAGPAAAILVSQLELLLPGLASAESGAVLTDVNTRLDGLTAKLQAVAAAT